MTREMSNRPITFTSLAPATCQIQGMSVSNKTDCSPRACDRCRLGLGGLPTQPPLAPVPSPAHHKPQTRDSAGLRLWEPHHALFSLLSSLLKAALSDTKPTAMFGMTAEVQQMHAGPSFTQTNSIHVCSSRCHCQSSHANHTCPQLCSPQPRTHEPSHYNKLHPHQYLNTT